MIRYVLFDLDETLYPPSSGLMPAIGDRMRLFMQQAYALSPQDAYALQKRYWHEYGTTLRGLMLEHAVDPRPYLDYVHDVDVTQYLAPNPALRAQLRQIPYPKAIMTNADTPHALRVLNQLGLTDQFTRIFDIVFMEYECKPARGAYERVLTALAVRGAECILVEDTARNLKPARELDLRTILVQHPDAPEKTATAFPDPAAHVQPQECPPFADLCIGDILQVSAAVATLAAQRG